MLGFILMFIGPLVGLIPILWLFVLSKKKENSASSKKLFKYAAIICLLLLGSSGVILGVSYEQKIAARNASIRQQKQEKKQQENDPNVLDSKAQIKKVNKGIAISLKDDQNHLNGDSNPNSPYAFSNKVKSIQYLGNKKIVVQVTSDFLSLNDEQKKAVIDSSQDCAFTGIIYGASHLTSSTDAKKGLYSTIKFGNTTIGHSDSTNFKNYEWSNA